MPGEQQLLTVTQAAQQLAVSPNTLRKWSMDGRIRTVRLPSGHRRYEPAVIAEMRRELGFQDAVPAAGLRPPARQRRRRRNPA
jgi:excisionase family DNA binding protein